MSKHHTRQDDGITPDNLRQLLSYDPANGILTWQARPNCGKAWNTKYAGKAAGTRMPRNVIVRVNRRGYPAHVLIWALMTGAWPSQSVDHKDRDPWNNRWLNLREASPAQQCQNRRRTTSLPKGVRTTGHGRYIAVLGSFASPDEAHAAWLLAARAVYGEFFSPI